MWLTKHISGQSSFGHFGKAFFKRHFVYTCYGNLDLIDKCSIALYYLAPIGARSRELVLKAHDHDPRSKSQTQTLNSAFLDQKCISLSFLRFNQTQQPKQSNFNCAKCFRSVFSDRRLD